MHRKFLWRMNSKCHEEREVLMLVDARLRHGCFSLARRTLALKLQRWRIALISLIHWLAFGKLYF